MSTIKEAQDAIAQIRGVWVPDHDDDGHHYVHTPSGIRVDSVTTKTILEKPNLVYWAGMKAVDDLMKYLEPGAVVPPDIELIAKNAKGAPERERDNAGSLGTVAHDIIENYLNLWAEGKQPSDIREMLSDDMDPRIWAAVRSAEKLFEEKQVYPLGAELVVGDVDIQAAGTFDAVMWNEKTQEVEIWDWKTSNHVHDTYSMQISAYKHFFQNMTGIKVPTCRIIHLSKNTDKYNNYIVPNPESAYLAFCRISSVYDWRENGEKKLEIDRKKIKI